jgi:hypothetical protein
MFTNKENVQYLYNGLWNTQQKNTPVISFYNSERNLYTDNLYLWYPSAIRKGHFIQDVFN